MEPAPQALLPESETPESKPKSRLEDVLAKLRTVEQMLDDPEFDGASLVEDMAGMVAEAIKDKIDGYEYVINEFMSFGHRMELRAKRFEQKALRAFDQADRIKDRLQLQMQANGFDALPGHDYIVKIKTHHDPKARATRMPTATDMLTMTGFVKEIPVSYAWELTPIKKAILANELVTDLFTLEYTKSIAFEDRDRPDIKPDPKAKRSGRRKS